MVLLSGRGGHKKRTRDVAAWGPSQTLLPLKMETGATSQRMYEGLWKLEQSRKDPLSVGVRVSMDLLTP